MSNANVNYITGSPPSLPNNRRPRLNNTNAIPDNSPFASGAPRVATTPRTNAAANLAFAQNATSVATSSSSFGVPQTIVVTPTGPGAYSAITVPQPSSSSSMKGGRRRRRRGVSYRKKRCATARKRSQRRRQ